MLAAYLRAEKFLPAQGARLVRNLAVQPAWIDDSDRFVYRRQLPNQGKEFLLVDATANTVTPAFDHARLAAALPPPEGAKPYAAAALPFELVTLSMKQRTLDFAVGPKSWRCSLAEYQCAQVPASNPAELLSPDGKWVAFARQHNIWVRSMATGLEKALTFDGSEDWSYGTSLVGGQVVSLRRQGRALPLQAAWSPDSTRLLTQRMDLRLVAKQYLVQSVPDKGFPAGATRRPILHMWPYPMVGDPAVPTVQLLTLDVTTGQRVELRTPPLSLLLPVAQIPPLGLFASNNAAWHGNGKSIYVVEVTRDSRTIRLWSANAVTGEPRLLIEEQGKPWVETPVLPLAPSPRFLSGRNQVAWWSQRDGWGHLYLYDLGSGKLVRQLTSGNWVVRDVLGADDKHLYISGGGREAGRDPYLRHVYRVSLDEPGVTLLTPEDADHDVPASAAMGSQRSGYADGLSPSGKYFVDVYSRVDSPSVSVLRASDGRLVRELERADMSAATALGYRMPQPFRVTAVDGKTDLHGILIYPSTFDPAKKYPVVEHIYPGPQSGVVPKRFRVGRVEQAIAELGFVVYMIDAMGTPNRSLAFHEVAFGNLGSGGDLKNHVEGLRQLQREHPYLDLDRVGIIGHSGGGYASARAMLLYPDFYKVAVSSAANHDQLGYGAHWGEKYQGMVSGNNYDEQDNALLAGKLKGKLMLAYGDMDDNVNPALTVQFMDALIKANKDFELLVLPNRDHGHFNDPYFSRRRWDFLVTHLLGTKPPPPYQIKP